MGAAEQMLTKLEEKADIKIARRLAVEKEVEDFHNRWLEEHDRMDYGWERGVTGNFNALVAPEDSSYRGAMKASAGRDRPMRETV